MPCPIVKIEFLEVAISYKQEVNFMRRIKNPWAHLAGYNCIGCSPNNPLGLHMCFFEDGDDIVCEWKPTNDHQGWLDTLHGGVQGMLLDEIASWVLFRKLQTTGVTSKMEVKYMKPVSTLDDHITLRARIQRQMRNVVFIDAELYNAAGEKCTQASLVYFSAVKNTDRESAAFVSCELEEE